MKVAIEMHRLPSELEELTPYEFWELVAGFKLRAEDMEAAREKK